LHISLSSKKYSSSYPYSASSSSVAVSLRKIPMTFTEFFSYFGKSLTPFLSRLWRDSRQKKRMLAEKLWHAALMHCRHFV
jgi:hypothetical protein